MAHRVSPMSKFSTSTESMASLEACRPHTENIDDGELRLDSDGRPVAPAESSRACAKAVPNGCSSSWNSMLCKRFGKGGDAEINGVIRWLDGLEGYDAEKGTIEAPAPRPHRPLPSGRARFCGSDIAPAAAICSGPSPKTLEWLQKAGAEDPDANRSRITGKVGRSVCYSDGESPSLDILGLRGGLGEAVIVTQLRRHGAAERAGVRCGYELVSVDGHKDLLKLPASEIIKRIVAPVTLVFLGFLGKFPAEVRLLREEDPLGLKPKESICSPVDAVTVVEEVVFQPGRAPLWLSSSVDTGWGEDELEQCTPPSLLYELHLHEARNLVSRAVLNEPEDSTKKTEHAPGTEANAQDTDDSQNPDVFLTRVSDDPRVTPIPMYHTWVHAQRYPGHCDEPETPKYEKPLTAPPQSSPEGNEGAGSHTGSNPTPRSQNIWSAPEHV